MKEDLLHFIWQSKLLMNQPFKTADGEVLQVVHPGMFNTDAGPDFFNAKVKIGDTLWAGNVEIHLKSSDWKNHRHQEDKKYNNVILHVVYQHDAEVFYDTGKPVPAFELKHVIPPAVLKNYQLLQQNQHTIACEKVFRIPPSPALVNWMERLLVERLQEKCGYIETLLERNNNHWEETFYLLTCRYFGMKTNAQPFEWLAERLPLQLLSKHKNNPIQVEAMVFGVAGFLEEGNDDPYINLMKREFDFLKQKYGLVPLDKSTWKFARTRPSNFPVVRLAQLAALICRSSHLLSKVLEAETIRELASLYLAEPNPRLDPFMLMPHETKAKQGPIGAASVEVLLINTVLPVLFLYGKRNGKEELSERALRFYEDLKAEDNAITRFWQSLNVQVKSSFESQALIQLKNSHCANLKCLGCIIGNEILLS